MWRKRCPETKQSVASARSGVATLIGLQARGDRTLRNQSPCLTLVDRATGLIILGVQCHCAERRGLSQNRNHAVGLPRYGCTRGAPDDLFGERHTSTALKHPTEDPVPEDERDPMQPHIGTPALTLLRMQWAADRTCRLGRYWQRRHFHRQYRRYRAGLVKPLCRSVCAVSHPEIDAIFRICRSSMPSTDRPLARTRNTVSSPGASSSISVLPITMKRPGYAACNYLLERRPHNRQQNPLYQLRYSPTPQTMEEHE